MRIRAPRLAASSSPPDRVRLEVDVSYASGTPAGETVWFEIPKDLRDDLVLTGDPWLVLFAPLAATLGEGLRVDAPVDPVLLRGVRRALAVWEGWFPKLRVPVLDVRTDGAGERGAADDGPRRRTASLFSGGVDSYFTVLRHGEAHHTPRDGPRAEISDFLTLGGADVPADDTETLDRLVDRLRPAAEAMGKRLILVSTNIRATRWRSTDWTRLSHGALLAAAGLVLGDRWDRVLIPASLPYVRSRRPWGSHPFVDPLFSTSRTGIGYDGARFLRTEKTERVARSELALRTLRVCWVESAAENCGRCGKCMRTMATLETVDALASCTAFPSEGFSLERLAELRVERPSEARMLSRAADFARERGRGDVAQALDSAVRGSYRRQVLIRFARKLDELGVPTGLAHRIESLIRRGTTR